MTGCRVPDYGRLRQRAGRCRYREKILFRCGQNKVSPGQPVVIQLRRNTVAVKEHPYAAAGTAGEERVGLFAVIATNQVSLAKGASGQKLQSINPTGIVFNDGNELFVSSMADPEGSHGSQGKAIADRQTGTFMTVKMEKFCKAHAVDLVQSKVISTTYHKIRLEDSHHTGPASIKGKAAGLCWCPIVALNCQHQCINRQPPCISQTGDRSALQCLSRTMHISHELFTGISHHYHPAAPALDANLKQGRGQVHILLAFTIRLLELTGVIMPQQELPADKRSDPRFLARIAIFNGPCQKIVITDYTVNVSSGGLFIETAKILPVDTQLLIKFKLPDMERVITCKSRVAWTNGPDTLKKPSLPPGMGLQFIDLSLEDMHAIRIYIDKGELVATW